MIHRFAVFAALVMLLSGFARAADAVTLTTLDGSVVVEGRIVSFDGDYYRVETEYGALTLDVGDVHCSGDACPSDDDLVANAVVQGSAAMIHRLMPPLLESFADGKGLTYRRIFTGDEAVIWELSDGEGRLLARIEGIVAPEDRALTQLASRDADLSLGLTEGHASLDRDVIALDALVPVVSVDNPVTMVSLDQLQGLLSGAIQRWSDVGGDQLAVELHLPARRDAIDAVKSVFPRLRLGEGERHFDGKAQAAAVARDPAALGLVHLSEIGNVVPLVVTGSCGLSTPATRVSVKAEDYPLTQPMFLHRVGARQPRLVREFIGYARSFRAQPVIRAAGFVDQGIGRIPFDRQGDRLANAVLSAGIDQQRMQEVQRMVETLLDGERLTLTFRFRDGSSDLDPQSTSNIRRLSDAIGRGEFDGKELMFIGFTDGDGPADANMRLSMRRARSVQRAVSAFVTDAPVSLSSDGYGEVLPMACDDTDWGRQVNRRVEVWVRPERHHPVR